MSRYPVPAEEIRREMIVVNSRFIATLAPAFSLEEAREFINRVRSEFHDASHNVPVYLIGHGNSVIAHSSDDGEPSGTAGRPALAVLQGSNLGDVAVVISRYFGGTKLGTGGLVRAYGDSVRTVVEAVPRAEKVKTHTVMFDIPYRLLERIRLIAARHQGAILAEDFAGEVTLTVRFAVESISGFQEDLKEVTNGSIQAEIIETQETLMPIRGPAG
ncbi:MAG: YigZ family protein [Omnitrophica WOR_2 bacterium]